MAKQIVVNCSTGQAQEVDFTPGPPPVPQQVYPLQMRRALRAAGMLGQVNGFVNSQGADVQDAWEYASVITRDNALIEAGRAALGMTHAQIDDLFRVAATL